MNTGELIKKYRKEMGLSAEELAASIGVSPSTIYRYENNDISNMGIDKLKALANTLHTKASMLLGWDNFPHEYDEMIRYMRQLNAEGQHRLMNYAEDLIASGKYAPETTTSFPSIEKELDKVCTAIDLENNRIEKAK